MEPSKMLLCGWMLKQIHLAHINEPCLLNHGQSSIKVGSTFKLFLQSCIHPELCQECRKSGHLRKQSLHLKASRVSKSVSISQHVSC